MDIMLSLQGLGDFLAYFAIALVAEAVFVWLYMLVTPHHEAALIKNGNTAAAVSLGGAVIGFTLPLGSAVIGSISLLDMAIWASIALVVQVIVFLVASRILRGLSARIESGDLAAGVTLAAASIAIGILNAASMTY